MSSFPNTSHLAAGIPSAVPESPGLSLPSRPPAGSSSYLRNILEEIKTIGAALRAGADRDQFAASLETLTSFFEYRAVQIRKSVFDLLAGCGSYGIAALSKALSAGNADIVEGAALSLGFITGQRLRSGKIGQNEAEPVCESLKKLLTHEDSAIRRAAYRGIRYLGGEEAKRALMSAMDLTVQRPHEFQILLRELAEFREPELLSPTLKKIRETEVYRTLGMRFVPAELCLLLTAPWLIERLDDEPVLALAVRLGYLGGGVRNALLGEDREEVRDAVEEILAQLPVVTDGLLTRYLSEGHDQRQALVEAWRDRVCQFSQVLMQGEERAGAALDIPPSGLSDLDLDLIIAAMRSTEYDSLAEEKLVSPFEEQDRRKYRRCYFAPPEDSAAWLKNYLAAARARFSAGGGLSEALKTSFSVDLCAAILEEQRTAAVDQRAAFASRWGMCMNMLDAAEGKLQVKREYEEVFEGRVPEPAQISDFPSTWRTLNYLWRPSHKHLLRYALSDPGTEKRVEELLAGRTEQFGKLSKGAQGILKLCAFDLLRHEPANAEQAWEELCLVISEGEAAARRSLPSFGIEIQSPNVEREKAHAWKQFLEWSGIPSPERSTFLTTVEAAFLPVWSAASYIPAIKALHRLGFHANYRFHSGFHLSIGADLGEEVKYIAVGLRYFRFDEKRAKPAEPTIGQLMLMSKGFVHRNEKCISVDGTDEAPSRRTEIRLAALQNEPESSKLHLAFQDYLPALQHLSAALRAWQRHAECSLLSQAWEAYRKEVIEICTEPGYRAAPLLDVDWFERTGEGRDPVLFGKLRSIPILKAIAESFRERPSLFREFRGRLQGAFLNAGGQIRRLLGG